MLVTPRAEPVVLGACQSMPTWSSGLPIDGVGGARQGKLNNEHARNDAQYVVLAHDVAGRVWACELVIGCLCVHACVMMSLGCMSQPQM